MRSLSTAATGMHAQQTNVEVISNNIANLNTTGYKRQRAEFQDLLYQDQRRVGSASSAQNTIVPTGIQMGVGVRTASVYRINEQGNLALTNNNLDLAINGRGYFQITLPNGQTAYTRAGSFNLSPQGQIVTQDGYTVLPGLTIPANTINVSINTSGQVSAQIDGQVASQLVGQFELATFPNEAGLQGIGNNLYLETPASGNATTGVPESTGFGKTVQSFLEVSNVNPVSEITSLITAQRAYEMNSKVITTSDEMLLAVTQLRS
ncbi:MAG: flagellar basal-body rod protein FlgG [Alphaproteobacteria bacterium]|nr:flagellar basal-body rod protein FlgG [Alphaproteobacteria bacterium]